MPNDNVHNLPQLFDENSLPENGSGVKIFARSPTWCVYRTFSGVTAAFLDAEKDPAKIQQSNFNKISAHVSDMNFLLHALYALRPGTKRSDDPTAVNSKTGQRYESAFARHIEQAITGDFKDADLALTHLKERLSIQVQNRARIWFFVINICLVASLLAIAVAGFFFFDSYPNGFGALDLVGVSIVMGGVGALFSTAANLTRMQIDATSSRGMHIAHSGQRVLIGALGAFILYLGIKSGLLAGLFSDSGPVSASASTPNIYWIAFISTLAGFSERLVPNLLENKAQEAMDRSSNDPKSGKAKPPNSDRDIP